jgi:hypothetical protein
MSDVLQLKPPFNVVLLAIGLPVLEADKPVLAVGVLQRQQLLFQEQKVPRQQDLDLQEVDQRESRQQRSY